MQEAAKRRTMETLLHLCSLVSSKECVFTASFMTNIPIIIWVNIDLKYTLSLQRVLT